MTQPRLFFPLSNTGARPVVGPLIFLARLLLVLALSPLVVIGFLFEIARQVLVGGGK